VESEEDNPEVENLIEEVKTKFEKCMDDDLNISGALGGIFEFMTAVNKLLAGKKLSSDNADEIYETMERFDEVLGVMQHEESELEPELLELIEKREEARENKDFKLSDQIRDLLKEKGIVIEDTENGTKWRRT